VDNEGLLPEEVRNPLVLPRYARVNTLKAQVDDILPQLPRLLSNGSEDDAADASQAKRKRAKRESDNKDDGEERHGDANAGDQEKEKEVEEVEIKVDEHLADLLVLPPTVKITGRHPLVQDGTLVLQDKVHCPPPTFGI
jgi:hypothetical protein